MAEKFYSIKSRLIRAFIFSALTAMFLSSIAIFAYTFYDNQHRVTHQLSQLANVIGHGLEASIDFDDSDSATTIMSTFHFNANIEAAYFLTEDKKIFASYVKDKSKHDSLKTIIKNLQQKHNNIEAFQSVDMQHIIIGEPIVNGTQFYGMFIIISDVNLLKKTLLSQLIVQSLVAVITLCLVILLAFKLQKTFTQPILKLKSAMERVESTDSYDVTITHQNNDEFSILFNGFNHMISKVSQQNALLLTEMEESKRSKLALSFEKKNIEQILANILFPVLITSIKRRVVVYSNSIAQALYERTEADFIDIAVDDVYTLKHGSEPIIKLLTETGKVESFEEEITTNKGKKFIGLLSVIPISYNNEACYMGMTIDISLQKSMENEIREAHKHTRDSIEYASLIQGALIPDNNIFREYFADFFAIWHPKDIVGGDIYLVEKINENELVIMVIDCTGHGVPGAFVTMLVKAVERQMMANIHKDKIISPAKLLSIFNGSIKHLLKQESIDSVSNAGFDGGILYYNSKQQIMRFSGANTPLFVIQNDKLKTIKGDRYSVGYKKCDANYEYTDHEIDTSIPTQIYLTTDGYLDQNGGEKEFPFSKKRFSKLIDTHHAESFADQKEILLHELHKYQGTHERNDDVTVVGLKV